MGKSARYAIYCLKDPESHEVRYVGVTRCSLSRRLASHLRPRSNDRCHRTHWIKSLLARGLRPVIEVVEEVDGRLEAAQREQFWIAYYKSIGTSLVNSTAGGDGMVDPCDETRAKLSRAMKGKKKSPQHAAAISAGKRGQPCKPDHIAKLADAKRGKPGWKHTPESRAKLSAARKGVIFTPEHIQNLRLSHLGKTPKPMTAEGKARMIAANTGSKRSEEAKRRLSRALTGRKLSPEHRRNMSLAHQRRLASRKQIENGTDS